MTSSITATVNLQPGRQKPTIWLSQYDSGRQLILTLLDGDNPWTPDDGDIVKLNTKLPDGTTISGIEAEINVYPSSTAVWLTIPDTITQKAGMVLAELVAYDSTLQNRAGSGNFEIYIEESPGTQ